MIAEKNTLFPFIQIAKKTATVGVLWLIFTLPASGVIDAYSFDNPRQEAQYRALIDEFRCPKCQNQNLAGSDAPIAQDLKKKTYDMVKEGRTDAEIRSYMSERYGDFISYKPPVRPSTWILWFLPPVILVVGLLGWWLRQRYRRNAPVPATLPATADVNPLVQNNATTDTTTQSDTTPLSVEEKARLEQLLNRPVTPVNPQGKE